jgi:hypothetical protein
MLNLVVRRETARLLEVNGVCLPFTLTMFHSEEINFTLKTKFAKIKDEYLNSIGYKNRKGVAIP